MTLTEAISRARDQVKALTGLPIDSISKVERAGQGWKIRIDVIESPARLGDNDLIAVFEVVIDERGELAGFERTGRYNRVDSASASAAKGQAA